MIEYAATSNDSRSVQHGNHLFSGWLQTMFSFWAVRLRWTILIEISKQQANRSYRRISDEFSRSVDAMIFTQGKPQAARKFAFLS